MTATVYSPVNTKERAKLDIKAGDTIRVWNKIQEKGKVRLQAFEGLVLARKHGTEAGAMITVRKVSNGVGVERIFPLYSPTIDSIEILKKSGARRSKLYFIRTKAIKEVAKRLKSIVVGNKKGLPVEAVNEEEVIDETPVEIAEENIEEVLENPIAEGMIETAEEQKEA